RHVDQFPDLARYNDCIAKARLRIRAGMTGYSRNLALTHSNPSSPLTFGFSSSKREPTGPAFAPPSPSFPTPDPATPPLALVQADAPAPPSHPDGVSRVRRVACASL